MNDSQLIDRLAATDLYPDGADLPETIRSDLVLLDIARRMNMDTMDRVQTKKVEPPRKRWNGPWIAAAAFALVLIIGAAGVLLTNIGDSEPLAPAATVAPPTTVLPADVDVNDADPIQATHDQAKRVTVEFAGDARVLAEGGVYFFEIQVHMDGTEGLGGREFDVTFTNTDGVITTTGTNPAGEEVTARWDWFAEDGVLVTLISQALPDTRPEVHVRVQETESSEPVNFVMDSPAP